MNVTIPQEISTEAGTLLSTNVVDETYPEWAAGTFTRGDKVILDSSIYEVVASTTDTPPDIGSVPSVGVPASWLRLGYVNSLRMFTGTRDSVSTSDIGNITTTFTSANNYYNQVALLGLVGQSVTITVLNSADEVQQVKTVGLVDAGIENWFDYFFAPFNQIESVVLADLVYIPNGKIKVEIEGTPAACGRVVLGSAVDIGIMNEGSTVGLLTFSRFERDGFGHLTVNEGRTVNTASFTASVEKSLVDFTLKTLRNAGGKIALYIGAEGMEATIILGIAEEPRINYSSFTLCDLTLEVEGQ